MKLCPTYILNHRASIAYCNTRIHPGIGTGKKYFSTDMTENISQRRRLFLYYILRFSLRKTGRKDSSMVNLKISVQHI